jgi:beta-glucanase (GH16 family)
MPPAAHARSGRGQRGKRRPGSARWPGRLRRLAFAVTATLAAAGVSAISLRPVTVYASARPVAGSQASSSPPAPPGNGPAALAGVPGGWKLIFDDEFNRRRLNTAYWSTGWFGSGITRPVNHGEKECYDPAQVSMSGGALHLTIISKRESCGISEPIYASGLISTAGKFTYTYGFLKARVYLPAARGNRDRIANWPAVWTDGRNWPADGEDDILEGLGGRACAHFHSAVDRRGVGAGRGNGCASANYAGGWHTFAADWEPGRVTYYYDGHNVGSVTRGITSAPMFIVLNYAAGPARAQTPGTMKVDYVRVWQHS